MKILVAGLVKDYQLKRLQEEGKKRGHQVFGCYASELVIKASTDNFDAFLRPRHSGALSRSDLKSPGFKEGRTLIKLENYDLIYLVVSKRRWEWYTAAKHLTKKNGTIIVNEKCVDSSHDLYLTPAIDYYQQTLNSLNYPRSALILSGRSVDAALADFKFPLIVKNALGRQGRGVYKAENKEDLLKIVTEIEKTGKPIVVREYVPNNGDIRVFCIGYYAIAAMKRTPTKGEFRSNISLGGTGSVYDLNRYPEVKKMAEKAAKITRTQIAGVDIIINEKTGVPYILEINPGPQFEGLEKYTGVNAAGKIIEYFESLLK